MVDNSVYYAGKISPLKQKVNIHVSNILHFIWE